MQVYNCSNSFYFNRSCYNRLQPGFRSQQTVYVSSVNAGRRMEYGMRVFKNLLSKFFQSKKTKNIIKEIASLNPQRDRVYLEKLAEIAKLYSTQKVIDANIGDNILEQIAQKGKSVIYIMNHSNQVEDPHVLAVLNVLLAEAYKSTNCQEFPLPKIVMNEDILKTMDPIKRKAYENLGAVGIDANIVDANKAVNTRAFLPLVKDFICDKCNIFIFPEGRLAVKNDLNLYDRFQDGVGNLINKIVALKKEVTVVPVAFAYGKDEQKNLVAMNIGTPIIVKRQGENTTITKGDINKKPESDLYPFFDKNKDKEDITITFDNVPVSHNDIPDYLKSILCENLEINSEIAQKKLEIPLDESQVKELYSC